MLSIMSTTNERIAALRTWISERAIDAWIVPTADPHQGEYAPTHFLTRGWLSGFHGSAGTVVVTQQAAGLWVDSRYYLEGAAAVEDSEIELFRLESPGVPNHPDWIASQLTRGQRVGFDARLFAPTAIQQLSQKLKPAGITVAADEDPFAAIWTDRPPLPAERIYALEERFAGRSRADKLAQVRRELSTGQSCFISTLDDIAWLLNLRGSDIAYTPSFVSYLLVGPDSATLYVDASRADDGVIPALSRDGVEVAPYQRVAADLSALDGALLLDPARNSSWIHNLIPSNVAVTAADQPSVLLKACKSSQEIENAREAHKRDGVAVVRLLRWLQSEADAPTHTELTISRKLRELRQQGERYIGDSFEAIVGYNAHGAIVHYRVNEQSAYTVRGDGVLLIDSGAQYLDGTTDITRTVAVGNPPRAAQEDYTMVLSAHIALATALLPAGSNGRHADTIARTPLWRTARDYGHGTGHGVGYVGPVHEGPQRLAQSRSEQALLPGMIVSNEPGLYREGAYGIRLENLVVVVPAGDSEFGDFIGFETLSLCPFDRSMILAELLSPSELQWIDRYHAWVLEELGPRVSGEDRAWLETACAPLGSRLTAAG